MVVFAYILKCGGQRGRHGSVQDDKICQNHLSSMIRLAAIGSAKLLKLLICFCYDLEGSRSPAAVHAARSLSEKRLVDRPRSICLCSYCSS